MALPYRHRRGRRYSRERQTASWRECRVYHPASLHTPDSAGQLIKQGQVCVGGEKTHISISLWSLKRVRCSTSGYFHDLDQKKKRSRPIANELLMFCKMCLDCNVKQKKVTQYFPLLYSEIKVYVNEKMFNNELYLKAQLYLNANTLERV